MKKQGFVVVYEDAEGVQREFSTVFGNKLSAKRKGKWLKAQGLAVHYDICKTKKPKRVLRERQRRRAA